MLYRKRPTLVEAFRFYVDSIPDWFMDKVITNQITLHNCDYSRYSIDEAYCLINTPEGVLRGNGGCYIIKEGKETIYPCNPDRFKAIFDEFSFHDATDMVEHDRRIPRTNKNKSMPEFTKIKLI